MSAVTAVLFYVAYTMDGTANRPLCIAFNGGPGAGSLWLHLGAIGPRRIRMKDDGTMPPSPYRLEDNQGTWLDKCDLVFVDPPYETDKAKVEGQGATRFGPPNP